MNLKRVELKQTRGNLHTCVLVGRGGEKQAVSLPPQEFGPYLSKLFLDWGKNPSTRDLAIAEATRLSRKGSRDSRYLAMMWMLVSFCFPGLLAMSLITDGYQTIRCTKALEQGKLTTAELQKVKKNRRGQFIWTLAFTTDTGKLVRGTRVPYVFNEKGYPAQDVTVVYSDAHPECWDLSMSSKEIHLNERQRLFTKWMTLGFGYCFAVIALAGLIWGFMKLRFKNPYTKDLERVVKELMLSTDSPQKTL